MSSDLHRKEADFHDAWANSTATTEIQVRAAFEADTAPENRFILSLMGDLRGKRVLDVGSGLGESSVYFALQGARVTSVDLSPAMVESTLKLARHHGVSVEGVVCDAESLRVPDESFDFVYVANLLHHVPAKDDLFRRLRLALKPGGRFFSWDPVAYNPVINVYRRMATKVRTEDEAPLTLADIQAARRHFPDLQHREFWLLTLGLFLKYYAIDRVHPNEDRYWKRILREDPARLGWFRALQRVDDVLLRVPGVRLLGWNTVLWGSRT